jgi:pimeloyl-ACP methyl ester carboxylesterase
MKIAERMMRSLSAAAAIVWAVGALTIGMVGVVRPAAAANTIETTYKTAGTFSVSTATVTDTSGLVYNLYYPTTLGAGGMRHPIITWGNGSNATPSNYYGLLNHLASWGFVVVAVDDPTTGTGAEMLAAAQYMVARDSDSASLFYQKLDTGKVGAIGHSQGAGGTVNVTNHSNGLIKSAVTIALPNTIWVSAGDEYYVDQLTVPVLFLSGSTDIIIASASTQTGFYNQVPGAAAKAVLKGAGHNTIQNSGGGFLGYINAWLMYTLRGDSTARGAFVGTTPEINTNTSWSNQAEKNLP